MCSAPGLAVYLISYPPYRQRKTNFCKYTIPRNDPIAPTSDEKARLTRILHQQLRPHIHPFLRISTRIGSCLQKSDHAPSPHIIMLPSLILPAASTLLNASLPPLGAGSSPSSTASASIPRQSLPIYCWPHPPPPDTLVATTFVYGPIPRYH